MSEDSDAGLDLCLEPHGDEVEPKAEPTAAEEQADEVVSAKSNIDVNSKVADPELGLPSAADLEKEMEEVLDEHDDEDLSDKKSKTSGGFTGRGVTLQMLLADNILQPKENSMSLEYMGQKFNGDLLADGRIRSAEVEEVFSSPSAWALRCKRIVNPEQKYGCGWSSVRYCGRPLDVYKNQWMRKRRMQDGLAADSSAVPSCIADDIGPSFKLPAIDHPIVKHESLGNRSSVEDPNVMVEAMSFTAMGKLQPFLVSMHTDALITIEVHCSMTSSQVVGYLAGSWDMNSNTLSVKQAYPCLNKLADATRGLVCELDVAEEMERNGVVLVGWYHSHPLASPTPTILDIDAQLEYQLKMKGTGEHGYRPCLGVLCSPFYRMDSAEPLSCPLSCYWVAPPPESRPQEVARPMAMQYQVIFDSCLKDAISRRIEACIAYCQHLPDKICFLEIWIEDVTLLDKLKASISSKLRTESDVAILELMDKLLGAATNIDSQLHDGPKRIKLDFSPEPTAEVHDMESRSSSTSSSNRTSLPCA